MAKYSNTVEYQIRTTLDSSGIAKLKAELASLQNTLISNNANGFISDAAFKKTMSDIKQVDAALTKAFNGKLGMLDLKKFNTELTAGGRTLNSYYKTFSSMGSQGVRAFGQMYGQLTKIDTGMKQVSSTTDKIANTFGNTFRWGVIASMFSSVMNAAHQATQYVKDLDESLTNIMMVSGESRDAMNEYARAANDAAKALGNTTVGMTNATQVFVQQGYDLGTSQQLAESSVILGNISQQDTATASDEITAYMNAFKININDLNNALSKWAIVANVSAADVEELSVASQKAASAAVTTGVNMDQLAAQIATIETVTREAPENIGNGLKTLYARFSDIKMGETLEDGVDLGKVTSTLEKVGVQVIDADGNMREVGNIMEDLMEVWGQLDLTQRNAIGQTLAGKFQYTRFSALMNRSDLYKDYLAASEGETGTATMDMMQEVFEESMQGRLNKLRSAVEGIFTNAFNTDDFYAMIDAATKLVEVFDDLIQSIGGGKNALVGFGAIATKVFSNQISQGIGNFIQNRQTNELARQNMSFQVNDAQKKMRQGGVGIENSYMDQMGTDIANVQQNMGTFSQEQLDNFNTDAQKHIQIMTEAAVAEEKVKETLEASEIVIRSTGVTLEENTSITERYTAILTKAAQAIADGVPFEAAADEMYKALETDTEKLSRELINLANSMENSSKHVKDDATSMAQWKEQASQLNIIVKELSENEAIAAERQEQLAATSEILTKIERGEIETKHQLTTAISDAGMKTRQFYESLAKLGEEGVVVTDILKQVFLEFLDIGSAAEVSSARMKGWADIGSVQNFVKGVTSAATGVMNVVFAVQSVRSAISALTNEDLNPFEKLEQSLMGLSMAAVMILPSLTQLHGWYNKLALGGLSLIATNMGVEVSQKAVDGTSQKLWTTILKETEGTGVLVEEKIAEIAAREGVTAATIRENAVKNNGIIVSQKEAAASGFSAIAKQNLAKVAQTSIGTKLIESNLSKTLTTALFGEAASAGAAAAGTQALGATVTALAGPVGVAIAAIAALVAILYVAYRAYTADARAAQEAKEAMVDMNKAWQDSKTRLDEFNQSLESLEEVEDSLKTLTTGTEEWNEKLKENNDLVLELLNNYPELAKYIERTEDGQLKISGAGKAIAQQAMESQEQELRIANLNAQNRYSAAQRQSDITDAARSLNFSPNESGGASGLASFHISSEDLSNLVNIMNTQNKSVNELTAHDLAEATGWSPSSAEALLGELKTHGGELEQIAANTAASEESDRVRFDEMMKAQMGDSYNPNTPVADQMFEQYQQKMGDIDWENRGMDIDYYAEQYAKEHGYTTSYDKKAFSQKDDKVTFYDVNGEEITTMGYDAIRQIEESARIMDEVTGSMDELSAQWKETQEKYGTMGSDILSFDSEGNIEKDKQGKAKFDFSGMTQADVEDMLNDETALWWQLKDEIGELGYESWDEFWQAFQDAAKSSENDLKVELTPEMFLRDQAEIDSILEDAGLEPDQLDDYVNQFMKEGGAGVYQGQVNTLIEENGQLKKSIENLDESSETYEKDLDRLNQQLENNQQRIQELALDALESSNAIGTLSEKWGEWSTALNSDDIAAKSAAYSDMKEVLADLLNIDVSGITDDMIQSPEVLDAMNRLANGDISALNTLRQITSDPIVQQVKIEDNLNDEEFGWLQAQVEAAQAMLPDLEVGATLTGDTEFIQHLQNMVAQGRISAESMQKIFEAMGYDVHVEYKDVEYENLETAVDSVDTSNMDPMQGAVAKLQAAVQWKKTGKVTSQVPELTFTKKGDPAPPSGGSTGSKGGSGGGSGSGSSSKAKKYNPKEKDRYEKVNTAIDKIDSSLQNLTMDQDRLFGTRWIDNLEQETELLKEQIPWYEQKLKIQKEEAKELQNSLKGFGAQFGSNGQLQNYSQIFDKLQAAAKKEYESGTEDTTAQDRFEKFQKEYARYDTLWSKDMPATEKALKEIQDRLEDIAEEARKARREAAQELDDIRKEEKEIAKTWGEILGTDTSWNIGIDLSRVDDLINGEAFIPELQQWIADAEETLEKTTDKKQREWLEKQIKSWQDAIAIGGTSVLDLNAQRLDELMKAYDQWFTTGRSDAFGENEAAMKENIANALEDYKGLVDELADTIDNLWSDIEDQMDMMDNALDDRMSQYDAIADQIEYIKDMNELIYGDNVTLQQINLMNMQAKNEEERLKVLEKQEEEQRKITERYREYYEAHKDNKEAQERYLEAEEKLRDIQQEELSVRQQITETYRDAKDAANELAVDNWVNNFQGVIGGVEVPIEYMADQWERMNENADLYLDELNKAYEIQKLQNKYQQMLNDATDPTIQQQITDQMNQQLDYLRAKNNLSKYDVEYANAQLEILQKTIALEDARAAKNTMKLRRDSQGNYQYVYAADKNQTGDAENDLLDAQMNAYNMSKEQAADVQGNFISKIQDMSDALRKAANDQNLSKEQIQAITQSIIKDGYEYLNAMGEQLDESQKNMIQSFIDAAFNMATENAAKVQEIAQDLQDGITDTLDMVDDRFDTSVKFWIGDNGLAKFEDEANNTKNAIIDDIIDFESHVSDANANIQKPLNDMEAAVDDVSDSMYELKENTGELFNLLEQKSGSIVTTADAITDLQAKLTDANNKMSDYVKKINSLTAENKKLNTTITQLQNGTYGSGSGSGGAGGGSGRGNGNGRVDKGEQVYYDGKSVGYYTAQKAKPNWTYENKAGWYSVYNTSGNMTALAWVGSNTPLAWVENSHLSGFDTGGYTGAWGTDGRLAMLHQKELVLNATDTQNILAAVDAVRAITEQLKGSTFINNIGSSIGRVAQNALQGSNVEQRVEITANFPNVNSAAEIEAALLSISDTSYQYAYNKNDTPW